MPGPPYTRASEVINECAELKKEWRPRNNAFEKSYKVLRLHDELKAPDMESFVSNDPRTFYNLALHLLTPDVIPHRIKEEGFGGRAEIAQFTSVNNFLERSWDRVNRVSRRRGRQTWMRGLVGLMLATGWYAVWAYAAEDTLVAENWNPAEVYPDFGEEDLLRCAHAYTLPPRALKRKLVTHPGWSYRGTPNAPMEIVDYWYLHDDGVRNVVTMGGQIVSPDTVTPFSTIPILVSPVGGLPDWGSIQPGDNWRAEVGQPLTATNDRVYRDFNKQMSFLQQLLRDTAQIRLVEKSEGPGNINPADVFKRGAVFHLGLQDELD